MIPKIITGKSVNELNKKAFDLILNSGNTTTNRNAKMLGDIYVEYDVNCILENPRNRHLNLVGRKSNIFALIGETLWVMAGREDVKYLLNFIPRAADYSDDGLTWRASYGERMYYQDQLQGIIETFKEDGIFTRRATLTIYDPNRDTKKALKEVYGLDKTLDIPCNQWLNFYVDNDLNLNMKVIQRSGDAIWGAMSINLTEFSFLHEIIFNCLKETNQDLKLGSYNHSVTNFHIYEGTSEQAFEVLKHAHKNQDFENEMKIISPTDMHDVKSFFMDLTKNIESGVAENSIDGLFKKYDIPVEGNILYFYAYFTNLYYRMKQNGHKGSNKGTTNHPKNVIDFLNSNNEYAKAINDSSFRNFEI